MLNPLILANVKLALARLLSPAIAIAISTFALLAGIGIVNAQQDTIAKAMIAHWLAGLMAFVFWVAMLVSALERYTDVAERSSEYGLLRIFGASNGYLFSLLLQEAAIPAIGGALCGLGMAYFTSAVLEVISGGLIVFSIPLQWWPVAGALAASGGVCGALLALPRALAHGVKEAL